MNKITYRQLAVNECERIREINASQFIKRAWREVDGVMQLVEINYQDPDFPNGYENHLIALKETFESGGMVFGAFDDTKLIGFCSVNHHFFGVRYKYVLLDQLFISNEYRGNGIGKKLFFLSADIAKSWGADKIYICAGSAEETVAFYFAIGCEEAKEINQELYEDDARDYQLEYDIMTK